MSEPAQPARVEAARAAAGRREWQQAYDLLIEADARAPLTGPDLALLAEVAYIAGRLDVTIDTWERVHAQGLRAGDRLVAGSAAVRVALHLLIDTALMAPIRGWIKRAERLLEGYDDAPAQAWLAVVRNYERLLSGDFEEAQRWARQAVELGTRCDPAAAAVGQVAEARGLILSGDISRGLATLNEAAVAAVSGEIDPLPTGMVYCEVVCALQALAQYDLAEEWTAAMERWHPGQAVGSIHGRCRVHRAELLRLRGSCLEAEQEALAACEELRPYLRRELGWPLTELGRIRLRKGDLEGAEEAFLTAYQLGWDPQPGLALLRLAQGEVELAAESIRQALEHPPTVPSKEWPPNSDLRRAPLLEAQVEAEIAADRLDRACAASEELTGIAMRFESKALAASAALASGRVALAAGRPAVAGRDFARSAHLWSEIGAPYEVALARMGLAQSHLAEGNRARAAMEFQAARLGFERIGAAGKAGEAARGGGNGETDEAPDPGERPEARSEPVAEVAAPPEHVFCREGDYWTLAFQGLTVRLRDQKGLRHLSRLLADPGRELHVLDLVAMNRGWSGVASSGVERQLTHAASLDAGVWLDAPAKEAYRRRITETEEDIEEARALGDEARAAQAEAERDFLIRELAHAVGLGGRDRRVGSASERARASVTRAIRQALSRINEHHPTLGEHLDRTVRTGTYCSYLPDPRVPPVWRLEEVRVRL